MNNTPDDDCGTSKLWGTDGQQWSPDNRLPDVSYAGYRRGEEPIPDVEVVADVTDYGAVGDGRTQHTGDDTEAFQAAIDDVDSGAILVPEGRYIITDLLEIESSDIVLRGEHPATTHLCFPLGASEVAPEWKMLSTGAMSNEYKWSCGFIRVRGDFQTRELAEIVDLASRGDRELRLDSARDFEAGRRIEVFQSPDVGSLCNGDPQRSGDSTTVSQVVDITHVDGETIHFDRPLRFDVRPEFEPVIRRFDPTVTDVGIENFSFVFPRNEPWVGHKPNSIAGYNPLRFYHVAHCWARNLHLRNMDNGPMLRSKFCTIEGVTFDSDRSTNDAGQSGHHGIYISGDDNHFRDFTFNVEFVHDISISPGAGNVISDGRGVNLCFDHHAGGPPFGNVFTNIDAGANTDVRLDRPYDERIWESSGARERHAGSWTTFWNIRTNREASPPPYEWAGDSLINIVGLTTSDDDAQTDPEGRLWYEPLSPEEMHPQNLHTAQLERRLQDE